MSIFSCTGLLINVFKTQARVNKQTGESIPARDKLQILGEIPQVNGTTRVDLLTLSCANVEEFLPYRGQRVSVSVGYFSPDRGIVHFFVPQGAKPVLLSDDSSK